MENEKTFFGKNKEDVMRDNYQKMVSVLAANQIAFWEYDIPTNTCLFAEDYFRVLGLEQIGVLFTSKEEAFSYFHPDDVALFQQTFQQVVARETSNALIPFRCIGSKGEVLWLETHFVSDQKKEEENFEKLIAYTVNVTSKREKEAEIKRLDDRNTKIIEAIPEFIFIFDENFFFVDILMSTGTVLLHPKEELLGTDARLVYSPEVSELFIKNIHACLLDNIMREIEYPLDVNGQRFYFQARIAPFEDRKVLALIHDIGSRVRRSKELIDAKRKAEEADRMKTLFLANMSHEIRTPLNAIVGFSEIICATDDKEEKLEYMGIIQKNSDLLLQLINDILDLSRIESGKAEMYLAPVNLSDLLVEVEKVHLLKIGEGIKLEVNISDENLEIQTDGNRITQVLFNFMSNAIKNTREGIITLGLSLEGDWVRLYVSDTGCGIPEDKLPLIFNRFEKLNDFVQGTGLGLSICKNIIERLGGRIDVVSEFGKGSTFSIYLRMYSISETENANKQNSRGGRKILVADSSEVNYMQVNMILKKDYLTLWAKDCDSAIYSFLQDRPALVLVHIRLPDKGGMYVIEKIRAISASIPVIAVTDHTFYTDKEQAFQAGCNEVLTKPYSLDRLKESIDCYLK